MNWKHNIIVVFFPAKSKKQQHFCVTLSLRYRRSVVLGFVFLLLFFSSYEDRQPVYGVEWNLNEFFYFSFHVNRLASSQHRLMARWYVFLSFFFNICFSLCISHSLRIDWGSLFFAFISELTKCWGSTYT